MGILGGCCSVRPCLLTEMINLALVSRKEIKSHPAPFTLKILYKSRTSSSTITHGSSLQPPFLSRPSILSIELLRNYIPVTRSDVLRWTYISPKFSGTWLIVLVSMWNTQLISKRQIHSEEASLKTCATQGFEHIIHSNCLLITKP